MPVGQDGGVVAVASEANPTVARRELAVYFKRLREQRGHSVGELSDLLGVAQSQASRLDTGARGYRTGDVQRLCHWYGLGEGERRRLLALAEDARRRAWWQQVDLHDAYRTLIGFEQAAEVICEFCNAVVPGLLQTERYARAAMQIGETRHFSIDDAVGVRMRRQLILDRPRPPELAVVIDESVLARGAGGREVMLEQLTHLIELARRPRLTIQVIGFEADVYPVAASQFILLDMGSKVPALYYSENQLSRSDSSSEDDIRQGRHVWKLLQRKALSPVNSVQRIVKYRDDLKQRA
jgi:transcriptional regulator with XRE-family HTH domain